MLYRRGHQIVLQNERTDKKIAVKVMQYDSMQGWLAESADGEWHWYHMDNTFWPDHEHWKFVKKAGD